jgi:hypothetical protein
MPHPNPDGPLSPSAYKFCCKASSSTSKRPSGKGSQNISTAQPERSWNPPPAVHPVHNDSAPQDQAIQYLVQTLPASKHTKTSSAQPVTATIEPDSIEDVIILSTRSLHAMTLRNRKMYHWNGLHQY